VRQEKVILQNEPNEPDQLGGLSHSVCVCHSNVLLRQLDLEAGHVALVFLSGEVEDHGSVFVAFAPCPSFRDVIVILKAKDEVMLVPR
jgi:hypothetical protein